MAGLRLAIIFFNLMKWAAILFSFFIVGIIVLADNDMLGIMGFINLIPYGDKVGHFTLYGILTLLNDLAIFRSLPNPNLIAV